MSLYRRAIALLIGLLLVCSSTLALAADDENIVLHCWVYYNGVQEQAFDAMVREFNTTVGSKQGVFVEYSTKSNISELASRLMASAIEEPGAEAMPDLFASYSDTAFDMYNMGMMADISPYLTDEELDEYVDAYVDEGRMGQSEGFYIFPAAKATELLILNQTAWDEFQAATGADENMLATWEGIVTLGQMYFEWTDGQTPETEGDGHAFYGRDATANYLLVGSMELGSEIFGVENNQVTLNFDKATMRKLWDCYYVPYMSGWFTAEGRYRSDDIKTGQIIALVGSTSGAMYFPQEVTFDDGTSQPIECSMHPVPHFQTDNERPFAVQQGAGFVVKKSTPERERAAVAFLRWFTESERNLAFSMNSGYLPVKKEANSADFIKTVLDELQPKPIVRSIIEIGAEMTTRYQMYTNKPFRMGYQARQVLESSMNEAAAAGSAKRLELMADGATYAQAVQQLNTDEVFEQWYQTTLETLEQLMAAGQ